MPGPPPPHLVLFRVRICLFPYFESTPPPISGLTTFLNPPFAGFSCLGDPPKSKTLLNVPPIFYFITPFLNFSGVQRERERKTTPFFKEISGWKVKYPPFLQFSGRTLSHEKYPFTGDFGNTHAVPLTPEWGGRGGMVVICMYFCDDGEVVTPQNVWQYTPVTFVSYLWRSECDLQIGHFPGVRISSCAGSVV